MFNQTQAYTVGWIAALEIEYVVACEMLDEEYTDNIPCIDPKRDPNTYTFGRIHKHNVVITCLPRGRYGTTSAALVGERMRTSFPNIQIGLMVGIGGAAPSIRRDIRLGDVVVAAPSGERGGVLQYDFKKAIQDREFEQIGHLASPPENILNALSRIGAEHKRNGHKIHQTLTGMLERNPRLVAKHARPGEALDRLYQSSYLHKNKECDCQKLFIEDQEHSDSIMVSRKERDVNEDKIVIHYGLIASANTLMKDAFARDALVEKYDILCFEMEAAGLVNHFPCVVIRGMCDYSDSHKNDMWHGYAAGVAAAYAKELLSFIPSSYSVDERKTYCVKFSLEGIPCVKKFIPRSVEMDLLQETLLPTTSDMRRKVFVLRGMGGIGKTQLAIEFMRTYHPQFTAVFWLDGSSKDTLKQSLAQHAAKLPSNQASASSKEYTQGSEEDIDTAAKAMLDWLSRPDNPNWLIVFDNVDREYRSNDSLAYDIKQHFPNSDHGSILITTRLARLEQLGEFHEVKKVDKETAQAIFESRYRGSYDDSDREKLLDLLGGLPLAIAQAGAYLQESGMDIATYLSRYKGQWDDLVTSLDDTSEPLDDYPERSIWTTWTLSYNAIFAKDQHTAHLLLLWSYLDNADMWYDLFKNASMNTSVAQLLSKWIGQIAFQESTFFTAMRMLRSFSLVEEMHRTGGFSVHNVVHNWAKFYHGIRHQSDLSALAIMIVGFAIPDQREGTTALAQRLLPHAQACLTHMETASIAPSAESEGTAGNGPRTFLELSQTEPLLAAKFNIVWLLYGRNKLEEAELIGTSVLREMKEKRINHFLVLTLTMLGNLLLMGDNSERAEATYKEALQTIGEFGIKNEQRLGVVSNLAIVYMDRFRFAEAEKILSEALNDLPVIDQECWSFSDAMRMLAEVYSEQGKLNDAMKLLVQALQSSGEVRGPKYMGTIRIVYRIGNLFRRQGDLESAEAWLARALQYYEETFGPSELFTLEAVLSLGQVYSEQKKYDQGEAMLLRALQGFEEIFGLTSIWALQVRKSLGLHYWSKGDLSAAENHTSQSIEGYRKALDHDSFLLFEAMRCMGWVYHEQNRMEEAENLFLKCLQGYEKLCSPEAVNTCMDYLALKRDLADLYMDLRRYEKAKESYKIALNGYVEMQGLDPTICPYLRERIAEVDKHLASNRVQS